MTEEKPPFKPPAASSGDVSPWALAGLGMQFFIALFGFAYAGNWADTRFGTSPLLLMTGVFVGGGGTFYLSYRRLTRTRVNEVKSTKTDDNTPS